MRLRKVNFENKFCVNKNLIHIISNLDVLILAYKFVRSNLRDTMLNLDNSTLNDLDILCLKKISAEVKAGQFLFSRECKKHVSKLEKESLDVINLKDEVVQKSIQMVLEPIFEPIFLKNSHGFRPNCGTHTALKMVKNQFHGVV